MSTVAYESQRSSMTKTWRKKEDVSPKNKKKELACNTESVLEDSDDLNIAGVELIYHCFFPAVSSFLKSQKIPLSPDYCDISEANSCDITVACVVLMFYKKKNLSEVWVTRGETVIIILIANSKSYTNPTETTDYSICQWTENVKDNWLKVNSMFHPNHLNITSFSAIL